MLDSIKDRFVYLSLKNTVCGSIKLYLKYGCQKYFKLGCNQLFCEANVSNIKIKVVTLSDEPTENYCLKFNKASVTGAETVQ